MQFKLLLLFLVPIILFKGCTLIGLVYGLNEDADKRNSYTSSPDLYELELGEEVTFILTNRDTITGYIVQFDTLRSFKYAPKYDGYHMLGRKKIYVPNINDSISINSNNRFDLIFSGFSDDGIKVYHTQNKMKEELSYSQFEVLFLETGQKVEVSDLENLFSFHKQPWRIKYIIKSNNMEYAIDSNDIAYFKPDEQYYGWLIGMLAGAGIDLVLITIFISAGSSFGTGLHFGN
jgi:hypothetical protein